MKNPIDIEDIVHCYLPKDKETLPAKVADHHVRKNNGRGRRDKRCLAISSGRCAACHYRRHPFFFFGGAVVVSASMSLEAGGLDAMFMFMRRFDDV